MGGNTHQGNTCAPLCPPSAEKKSRTLKLLCLFWPEIIKLPNGKGPGAAKGSGDSRATGASGSWGGRDGRALGIHQTSRVPQTPGLWAQI